MKLTSALRDLPPSSSVRIGILSTVVAVVVLGIASYRALRPAPVPILPAATVATKHEALPLRSILIDPAQVVERDIFSVDRIAPDGRYPMPGEGGYAGAESGSGETARPIVLGTALGAAGNAFATVQISNGTPRIVRTGDRVGSYTVVSIERGSVTFRAVGAAPFQVFAP